MGMKQYKVFGSTTEAEYKTFGQAVTLDYDVQLGVHKPYRTRGYAATPIMSFFFFVISAL